MGLGTRFTLGFGLAALVIVTAGALVARQLVARRADDAAAMTLRDASAAAEGTITDLGSALGRAAQACASDEGLVGGPGRGGTASDIGSRAEALRLGQGLDAIWLVDDRGKVLGKAGPATGALGAADLSLLARGASGPAWAMPVAHPRLLVAARKARRDGNELTVIVARNLADTLLPRVQQRGVVEARLTDAQGQELGSTDAAFLLRLASAPTRQLALVGPGGTPAATLTLAARDDGRVHALTDVTLASLALGAFAVGLAVVIGWIVARRLTRGLSELTDAARSARAGDFDFRVQLARKDELGELAKALNAMLVELGDSKERLAQAERVAAWQEIARGLAHELKNPLTPIQMSVETLRKSRAAQHPEFDEIFEESTHTVLEEVARLKRIISEFSQFARLPRPALVSCDLNELVGAAMSLYQGAVKVVAELAPSVPPVRADRDQLTQVILNLMENARDAIAARGSEQSIGRITVRTRVAGDRLELGVEDNGPGFDPNLKDRIFDSYFTTKTGGTGLGLAIVRRIITEHGGRVTAASTGNGARFTIELPIA